MSFLNPFDSDNWGDQLNNGIKASYNGYGATKDVFNSATAPPPPGPTTASDIYAALTREQWETYVNTFVPIENQLIQYATDKTQPMQAAQIAGADVNSAFNAQAGDERRRLQSLGVQLGPQEQEASQRQSGIARSLATVQGQNLAMDLTRQRQMGILGNPTPTAGSIAQQASGLPG